MLTPEELARNEQIAALFRNRAGTGVPRRMPTAEIDQLINAAAIIGGGRAEGLEDSETIQRFIRKVVNENDRRRGIGKGRERAIAADLKEQGLEPDDLNAKNLQEILKDEAEFGFAFEEDAMEVADGRQGVDKIAEARAALNEARKMPKGRARAKAIRGAERDLRFQEEIAKNFDFGLNQLDDGRVFESADIPNTTPRVLNLGNQDFEGPPLPFGRVIPAQRLSATNFDTERIHIGNDANGQPIFEVRKPVSREMQRDLQIPIRGLPGVQRSTPEEGEYIEFGIDPRERGRFVQRGAEIYTDSQGVRRIRKSGEVGFEQGGGFIQGPNGPIQLPAHRVKAERDTQGRAVVPAAGKLRLNQNIPVGLGNTEQARLNEQDRAQAQSEARRFERFERGDLTPSEMENRARLDAARETNEVFVKASGKNYGQWENDRAARPIQVFKDEKGIVRGLPREGPDKRTVRGEQVKKNEVIIQNQPFNPVSPDDAKAAILSQLQQRAEANRGGRIDRIKAMNLLDAVDEANALLIENRQPGPAGVAPVANTREGRIQFGMPGYERSAPNIGLQYDADVNALGQIKGDKLMPDMGLQLGSQRATPQNAIRIQNSDGSYEYVDRAGNRLAAPTEKTAQTVNLAEALNAPDGANNVIDFIQKNEFEDRGAQFFGSEAVIAQMNDKGAGGGIEQVDIGGALRGIEEKVAARLGIPVKRINGAQGFQNAMQAIIDDERRRGNALIRLENGEKVKVDNPGVEEALLALKVQPAEARQIANALKQKELAQMDRFDPRVAIDSAVQPGPNPANVFGGLDDPKRGGDRLNLGKDVKFQNKVQGAVSNMPTERRDAFYEDINVAGGRDADAGKPFVGRLQNERAFGGFNNVLLGADGKAMDPVDVRLAQEARVRGNRQKKQANAAKRGKKVIFGPADDRADVAKIRQMQEGNVFAAERAKRDEIIAGNRPYQDTRGKLITPTQRTVPGEMSLDELIGRARAPHPKARLKDRPVRPNQVRVEDAGEGFRNVDIADGYVPPAAPRPEGAYNQFQKEMDLRAARGRQRRDIGIVSGAALASILGLDALTRKDEEQEAV